MRSSNGHTGALGRISVEAATRAASLQAKIKKIRTTWDTFRKADTVRVSVLRKHIYSSVFDVEKAVENLPMSAVAPILKQHLEEQIQELNEEIVALGFEPTIDSLEPRSEEEAFGSSIGAGLDTRSGSALTS